MAQDSRLYPTGRGGDKSRPISGTQVDFGVTKTQRTRVTVNQLNAGFTLLPALPGVKWRLVDASFIAVGGAAAAATSIDLVGTRAAATVRPLVAAIAALTRSALARIGATNMVILADGASFTALDANTALTIAVVGSTLTTLTNLDVSLTYVADAP